MLRIILAEDDPSMRLILRRVIEKVSELEVVAEAENGAQLLHLVERLLPDVVFLDISMPTVNGLEAAKRIFSIDPSIALIFATAHDNYTHEAFAVYAFDYIVKPFNLDRIRQTLTRIKMVKAEKNNGSSAAQKGSSKLIIKANDRQTHIDTQDIIFVTRSGRQTIIHTTKGSVSAYEPLQSLGTKLAGDNFFRCHKGYIINADMVKEVSPWGRSYLVKFAHTSETALMTRERAKEFKERYSE